MSYDKLTEGLKVLQRINVILDIILTLLAFCFTPRKRHVSVLFVTNLLISNLVLSCCFIPYVYDMKALYIEYSIMIGLLFALIISLVFRMCIAVERYMIIAHPPYVRGTWTSVLACVAPWVLCFLMFCVCFALGQDIFYLGHLLLLGLLLSIFIIVIIIIVVLTILFVVLTFVALCTASSVATEEKRRTAGVLVLLLVDNFLLITPAFILYQISQDPEASIYIVLFTVFVDLMIFSRFV